MTSRRRRGEYERARDLYERLLEKATHPKVWISYAQFEINVPDAAAEAEADDEAPRHRRGARARARHLRARPQDLQGQGAQGRTRGAAERLLAFEKTHGTAEDLDKIQTQMPRRTKKKRKLDDDSWEEYVDYVFPADDQQTKNLSNLLAMAQAWKQTGGTIGGS